MFKPMTMLVAAAVLLAGCGHITPGAAGARTGAMQALKQDRRPEGPTQSAMDDLTYMKMVDRDRNAQLSFDEFQALGIFPAIGYGIKVQPTAPTLEDVQRKVFHDFDKNDDGILTSREFKELGATISSFATYKSLEEVVILIDMNEDGVLTLREWKMLGIFGIHRRSGDPSPKTMTEWLVETFDRLDTNDDGNLKEKEQRMVWQTMWYDNKPFLK